jgi:hypothetical protein
MWLIGTEAAQFLEKEYINGIFVAVRIFLHTLRGFIPGAKLWTLSSYSYRVIIFDIVIPLPPSSDLL